MNDSICILVVDDDFDVLNGTVHLLEKAGYTVEKASSGEDALLVVKRTPTNILLLDRDMPGIDGVEVCRQIKQDPALADVLVVITSGLYTTSNEQAEGLESGADGYIVRPIDNRELLARVDSFVRIQQLTRSLRESENKIRLLLNSTAEAIFGIDTKGICTFCNNACLHLLGYNEPGELLGKNMHWQIHSKHKDGTHFTIEDCRILKVLQKEKGTHVDDEVLWRLDGSSFPVEYWSYPQNIRGKVVGAVVTFLDITERRKAEEELLIERKNLKAIFSSAPVGVLLLDDQFMIVDSNAVIARLVSRTPGQINQHRGGGGLGCKYSFDDPRGCGYSSRCPLCQLRKGIQLVLSDGASVHGVEMQYSILIDGILHQPWISFSAEPVSLNGRQHVVVAIDDITARKQAEDALMQTATRLSLAARAGGVGVWDYDLVNNNLVWDDEMYRLYGIDKKKFGGEYKSWRTGLHPDDVARGDEEIQMAIRGEKEFDTEFRVIWPDGSVHSIRANALVQRDGTGKAVKMVGTNWDITKQKESELKLLEATAQAEMANAAKNDFLSTMSHEIRTPMNGVIGIIGLLLDTSLNDEQRRYADMVRRSGENLLELVNDILDYSKIEAGKLDLEILDFDLRAMLDDFAAIFSLRVHEKGLEFICSTSPEVPALLRGDPGRLRQILTNLAGNAVKFTTKGKISILVNVQNETSSEVVLRFSVKDTGIGIPVDKQNLLFQKFTQVDSATSRKYGGTGLGLAISKQLSEMMGGEIGLTSTAGQGSEFWFTARFEKQPEQEEPIKPLTTIAGMRLLVVDDNATNRDVLMSQLAAWDVVAEEAVDGLTGLSALYKARDAGKPFIGAILDLQMPGMTSTVLAQAIKADESIKNTRLLLLTSISERGDAKRMKDIGFAAYLTKPVRQADLRDCLSTVLTGAVSPKTPTQLVTRHTVREMNRRNVRILLAEDNIINQQVALGILKKIGLHADPVANGKEAIHALKTIPYDLVLMDIQMQEMDGYEATMRIRDPLSGVFNHEIPIIAMTANAMRGDKEKCLSAGMNDYISKPISPNALLVALDKWLPINLDPVHNLPNAEVETNNSLEIFDHEDLMERLMNDEVLVSKVTFIFINDMPELISSLKESLRIQDAKGTEINAHSIKGAAGNIGTNQLRNVAAEMEIASRSSDFQTISSRMPELEKQFNLAVREIKMKVQPFSPTQDVCT